MLVKGPAFTQISADHPQSVCGPWFGTECSGFWCGIDSWSTSLLVITGFFA